MKKKKGYKIKDYKKLQTYSRRTKWLRRNKQEVRYKNNKAKVKSGDEKNCNEAIEYIEIMKSTKGKVTSVEREEGKWKIMLA